MSRLWWPVLAGGALIGSPALWAAYVTRTLSPDVAMMRLGLCVVVAWVVLNVFAALTGDDESAEPVPAASTREMQQPADADLE